MFVCYNVVTLFRLPYIQNSILDWNMLRIMCASLYNAGWSARPNIHLFRRFSLSSFVNEETEAFEKAPRACELWMEVNWRVESDLNPERIYRETLRESEWERERWIKSKKESECRF